MTVDHFASYSVLQPLSSLLTFSSVLYASAVYNLSRALNSHHFFAAVTHVVTSRILIVVYVSAKPLPDAFLRDSMEGQVNARLNITGNPSYRLLFPAARSGMRRVGVVSWREYHGAGFLVKIFIKSRYTGYFTVRARTNRQQTPTRRRDEAHAMANTVIAYAANFYFLLRSHIINAPV